MTLHSIPQTLRKFANTWLAAATGRELGNKPLSRIVLGLPIVLFRHSKGVSAMLDRCPHRNVPLSAGTLENDHLRCNYHGWEFNSEGKCKKIPGLENCPEQFSVPCFSAVEENDLIFVRLNSANEDVQNGSEGVVCEPTESIGFLPEDALSPFSKRFDTFIWANKLDCNFFNAMENLLDPMHPAFVHSFLVRTSSRRNAVDVKIKRTAKMLEVIYEENQVAEGLIPSLLEGLRTESIGRYYAPLTAQLEYRGKDGPQFVLTTIFTPEDETHTQSFSFLSTPRGLVPAFIKEAILRLVFDPVLKQDQEILSLQSRNISRFGSEQFVSTKLDIVRPHILQFLSNFQNTDTTLDTTAQKLTPLERSLCIEI